MFKHSDEAIEFIDSRTIKSSFESYLKKIQRHHIPTNFTRFIHVTGTNGKGSTTYFLSQMLIDKGYKVGVFTSPYIISYHDRFRINNQKISDQELLNIVNEYYDIIIEENLSKFEIDVLIMLVYFSQLNVDYAIVEVGIGGKTDKTNVIESCLSLITNIGYDHVSMLGDSLEEITMHKAGIIKPNSCVITTIKQPQCLKIVEKVAQQQQAKFIKCDIYQINKNNQSIIYLDYVLDFKHQPLYQINNFCLALEAFNYLGYSLSNEQMNNIINLSLIPGRFESINERVIIDGAHNIQGIEALMDSLDLLQEKIVIIFSALKDKDYMQMIHLLKSRYLVYITIFEDQRQLQLADLNECEYVFDNFEQAYKQALTLECKIVITGSLHFISFVREKLCRQA